MDYNIALKNIRTELSFYIQDNNIQALVLGVSGGVDSALVAVIAKPVCDALKIPLIGRSITIESNTREEKNRAFEIGDTFCSNFDEVDHTSLYEPISLAFNGLGPAGDRDGFDDYKIRNGNIKARLRMMYLYDIASKNKGLVLSTDNWTEYLLGFWTLHGDVGDYGMIQELWKTEVYDMSEWLIVNELSTHEGNCLRKCIDGVATDGLGITNSDLDQILPEFKGTSRDGYKEVDDILKLTMSGRIQDRIKVDSNNPVIKRHIASEYKRITPINIRRENITNPN